ncbi:MAG: DUF3343 domain-containing protein [Chloroflexota bacterium]
MSENHGVQYGAVLFHSVSHALRAERMTQRAGLQVKLIPVPRQFSSNCGTALRFFWADGPRIQEVLREARLDIEAVHKLE